jgi:nicotinate-nucleotide adenylyltransferase
MRVGVFGGSFDPVHLGHLLLAECCREQRKLDRVFFVPAAVSPHKQGQLPEDVQARLEMLQLATGGHPAFEVSRMEADRGGISYTVDTLSLLKGERPEAELFLLMGADALAEFGTWRSPREICELARLIVVARPGSPPVDFSPLRNLASASYLDELTGLVVTMPLIQLSSTAIRESVSEGRSIRFQVPRAVEEYIYAHRLYAARRGPSATD